MSLIVFLLQISPFNQANFVALPVRSLSIFTNPAGLGINQGGEIFFTYLPKRFTGGVAIGNLGFGILRDTLVTYELGAGVKLPGAFALGFARQSGDTTESILGILCRPNNYLIGGFKTNLEERKYLSFGMGISLLNYLILAGQMDYEGIAPVYNYHLGIILMSLEGVNLNFLFNKDSSWGIGIELYTSKLKLAGLYFSENRKFIFGIMISAQNFGK
uniref:Type IX secretion system membrane protein PorP/SprF n=1 Tax=candidate division WOR-3 bacterium TaxID=2052148 RepID=A0A7C4TCJ8_UNCW3